MKDYEVINRTRIFTDGDKKITVINGRGLLLDQDNSFSEGELKSTFPHRYAKIISDLTKRNIIKKIKKKEEKNGGD